jgi:hypothetical protein
MSHENWKSRQSELSGSVSLSAFQDFDPDTDSDPDSRWILVLDILDTGEAIYAVV